jgi:hypothetical protein
MRVFNSNYQILNNFQLTLFPAASITDASAKQPGTDADMEDQMTLPAPNSIPFAGVSKN